MLPSSHSSPGCTWPSPQYVQLARQACELTEYKQSSVVLTLAAAHAEAGEFADAVSAAEKAHGLAVATGQSELARRTKQLLKLFRSGQGYHEVSQSPDRQP